MIKQLLALALTFTAISSSLAQRQNFTLIGDVTGVAENTQVALTPAGASAPAFSAPVHDGKFHLKGKLDEPGLFAVSFSTIQGAAFMVFLEPTDMKLDGHVKAGEYLHLTGSTANDDFERMERRFDPLFTKRYTIGQQIKTKGNTADLQEAYTASNLDLQKQVDQFISTDANSLSVPILLMQFQDQPSLLESRFARLGPVAQQSVYGRAVQQMIEGNKVVGAVGSVAPDFSQNDVNGKLVSLSSFRGKYVLVDFWASWCGPCRRENPNVVRAYNTYKDKNFTVLGISLDQARASWLQAIKADGLAWTQVSDLQYWNNAIARQYKVQSIPTNMLLDPNGVVIGRDLRGSDLETRLAEVLK